MKETTMNIVADRVLPLLVTLVQARKQARWQYKAAAGEHKERWECVITRLDERISMGEKVLEAEMNLVGFRVKREVIE